MADPVRDEEHAPAVKPDDIRRKTFSTSRRGYDQTMVDTYLRSVAESLRDAQKREADMRSRLGKAVRKADEAVRRADEAVSKARAVAANPSAQQPSEEELTARLGAEVTQVLESARSAAEERTARADAESRQVVDQARQQSQALLAESQSVLGTKTNEAAAAATRIIDAADEAAAELTAEAEAVVQRAQQAGLEHLRQAHTEGEGIVTQAEVARKQILKDMDRRRRSMRAQVEQLRAARDRLLESHSVVQNTLDEAKQELKHSLIEAKVRGEGAARQAGEARYLNHEELETEVADSVLVGRIELPDIEFRDDVGYQQILGARPEEIDEAAAKSAPSKAAPNKAEPEAKKAEPAKSEPKKQAPAAKQEPTAEQEVTAKQKVIAKQEVTAKQEPAAKADDVQWADEGVDEGVNEGAEADDLSSDPFVEPADLAKTTKKAKTGSKSTKQESAEIAGLADEIIAELDDAKPADVKSSAKAAKAAPKSAEQPAQSADSGHPAAAPQEPAATPQLRLVKTEDPAAKTGADPVDLPEEQVEIADLFARIRSRDDAEAAEADLAPSAARKFGDPDPDESEWEYDDEELPAAARADAIDLAATRDEAICDVEVEVGRRLKRILADEQNALLEAAERSYAGPLVEVLPELDAHVGIYLDAVVSQLENAIAAGAMFVDPAAASPKLLRANFEPAVRNLIVEPIRERLGDVNPNDDVDAAMRAVRGFYREHKRENLAAAGVFMVLHAFARGTAGTIDQRVGVRWVFIEADRGCPDGHDNELAGPLAVGEVFPSGAQMPPIAPGCRCLLVPADR